MLSGAINSVFSLKLTNVYKQNQSELNTIYSKLASGTKFSKPSDNITDYIRTKDLGVTIKGFYQVQRNIVDGISLLQSATNLASSIYQDLQKLDTLLKSYHTTNDTDEQTFYQTEYNSVKSRINNMMATKYDDRQLIADSSSTPLRTIILDPNKVNNTFNLSFSASDVPSVTGLTIGSDTYENEHADLQAELDKIGSYLAKASVYMQSLESFSKLTDDKIIAYYSVQDNASKVDYTKETFNLTKKSINQQAAVVFLAQSNVNSGSILKMLSVN